jgi:tRNA threonylcarbamoyladenosine biosynthesis protein TsaB
VRILSLSTAEQGCSLAFFENKTLVCEEYWASKQTHSKRLLAMVENLVENRAGIELSKIDGYIAAKGPGSFTGLRIGISVIKGLAYAMSRPEAGVSSLDGIAYRFSSLSVPVCVMMDARRNEVYCAVYHFEKGLMAFKSDEMVCSPEHAVLSAGENAVFAGSGSKVYQDKILELTNKNARFSCDTLDYVSAAALARPALLDDTFFDCPENRLKPSYIRKSDAELQFGSRAKDKPKTSILTQ